METETSGDATAAYPVTMQVIVKNGRVVVCAVFVAAAGPFYLQYHAATGWRDLEHGNTVLAQRMPLLIANPFDLE